MTKARVTTTVAMAIAALTATVALRASSITCITGRGAPPPLPSLLTLRRGPTPGWLKAASPSLALEPQALRAAQSPQALNAQDRIPFDKVVHRGTLPNGLQYYVRQNRLPANRVSLRLAVKAGSLMETDDQQGLAHLVEHMAFNGSEHFKPGEVFSYFESVGARIGPHVNAYTSFDETVYMLDLPSDKPEIAAKGLTALADFAGGLTMSTEEIDKERPVVIEEWRLGLGASSRIRDKQFPLLFYKSRYANRLPIGKPDIVRNAPPERLRAFYDTWYRPERMAVVVVGDIVPDDMESAIKAAFGPVKDRAPAAPLPDRTVPIHQELLVNVATDPEVTRSTVNIERKRAREGQDLVGDYRRDLVQRVLEHMMNERFSDLERRPDAKFLGAGVGGGTLSRDVATFSVGATVQDGKIDDGLAALVTETNRVREFGFTSSEVDRAKRWMVAFYERAFAERDKTESSSYAREYVSHFLTGEPSPGIDYEYKLVQQFLPSITEAEISAMAKALLVDQSRVVLAVSPQKTDIHVPTENELQATMRDAAATRVTAWTDTTASRALVEHPPAAGEVVSRRTIPDLGVTVVRFANGIEAWLKPTDFKNDQILFEMAAAGGSSLAPPADFLEATLADDYVNMAGAGGLKALDLQKMLAGKLASARPFVQLSSHGVSGSAAPSQLETALQLLYDEVTAPGDDPEAFALLKRQLDAAVANRGTAPGQRFSETISLVNTSNHYTAQPLTEARVNAIDRQKTASFYKQLFANASDFSFYMVGAFRVDVALPLVARYVGSLPSQRAAAKSTFKDVGIHFPTGTHEVTVQAGREPRGQTVISFFADPGPDPLDQERALEATTVLEITLRDILREDLGQTYGVSVVLAQALPQRGGGHTQIRFGSAPENSESMIKRVMAEIVKLQRDGPSADLTNRAKEAARRSYETALKQNGYWLARLSSMRMLGRDPHEILTRLERIDSVTPQVLQEAFKQYFPTDRATVIRLVPEQTANP